MVSEKKFNELQGKYTPLLKWFIESNQAYMNIGEPIKWCFSWDDNLAIAGSANRKTNVISFNLAYVDEAYSNNKLYDIEHFLIHEMRHVFQHVKVREYKNNEETGIDPQLIKLWIKEAENYVTSTNEKGEVNIEYFKQDCELDAYAFSFALMHHKHRGRYDELLYVPPIYKSDLKEVFDSAVNEFLESFH